MKITNILFGIFLIFLLISKCDSSNTSFELYAYALSEIHTRYGTSGIIFTTSVHFRGKKISLKSYFK